MPAPRLESLEEALAELRDGGIVAYPTETVWGLAADARSEAAIAKLRTWKGRDAAQPLSVLVDDVAHARSFGCRFPAGAAQLAERFWPGPLTIVVSGAQGLVAGVAGPDGSIGLRCSPHPVAGLLAHRAHAAGLGPLTATSLNESGEREARTRAEAEALCDARAGVALLALSGPDAGGEAPSTVVDATGSAPKILRAGAIEAARIEAAFRHAPNGDPQPRGDR